VFFPPFLSFQDVNLPMILRPPFHIPLETYPLRPKVYSFICPVCFCPFLLASLFVVRETCLCKDAFFYFFFPKFPPLPLPVCHFSSPPLSPPRTESCTHSPPLPGMVFPPPKDSPHAQFSLDVRPDRHSDPSWQLVLTRSVSDPLLLQLLCLVSEERFFLIFYLVAVSSREDPAPSPCGQPPSSPFHLNR